MSLEKTNTRLSIVCSLITIFGAIYGTVTFLMPSDRSPSTATTAPRSTPSAEAPPSKTANEKATAGNEPSRTDLTEKLTSPTKEPNHLPDEPLPFSARMARLVKIINFSALAYTIILLPVVLIGIAMWPPPDTPWATYVAGFGVLGSVFVLLYGVLTLIIGTCAGIMDWPATVALLVAIPFGLLDLILGGIVDQRNVNPDNLSYALREKHRARYTRKA